MGVGGGGGGGGGERRLTDGEPWVMRLICPTWSSLRTTPSLAARIRRRRDEHPEKGRRRTITPELDKDPSLNISFAGLKRSPPRRAKQETLWHIGRGRAPNPPPSSGTTTTARRRRRREADPPPIILRTREGPPAIQQKQTRSPKTTAARTRQRRRRRRRPSASSCTTSLVPPLFRNGTGVRAVATTEQEDKIPPRGRHRRHTEPAWKTWPPDLSPTEGEAAASGMDLAQTYSASPPSSPEPRGTATETLSYLANH